MNTLVLLLSAVSLVYSIVPTSRTESEAPLQAVQTVESLDSVPIVHSETQAFWQDFLQVQDTDIDEFDESSDDDLLQDSDDDLISILEDLTEIIFDTQILSHE